MTSVTEHFRPEFVNRIDEIVVFHSLGADQIHAIARIQLQGLAERLAEQHLDFEISDAAMTLLGEAGFDPVSRSTSAQACDSAAPREPARTGCARRRVLTRRHRLGGRHRGEDRVHGPPHTRRLSARSHGELRGVRRCDGPARPGGRKLHQRSCLSDFPACWTRRGGRSVARHLGKGSFARTRKVRSRTPTLGLPGVRKPNLLPREHSTGKLRHAPRPMLRMPMANSDPLSARRSRWRARRGSGRHAVRRRGSSSRCVSARVGTACGGAQSISKRGCFPMRSRFHSYGRVLPST